MVFLGGSTGEQVLLFTAALLLNWRVLPGGLNGVEAAFLTGPLRNFWKENAALERNIFIIRRPSFAARDDSGVSTYFLSPV